MSSKKASDPGVLGSLPSTRPARLGRRRESAAGTATKEPAVKAAAKPKKAAPKRAAAKPRPTPGPRAVRSGSPSLKRTTDARREPPPRPPSPPRGAELVTTAVKATGELAQIGFTVGGQVLKRAVRRIPHP